ncbi:helix-turn-helix domain-containing protein, partial [Enterococcus faecium]|nr:helix-turn-helix domain-containing protein [Enterococcus faecium]
CILKSINFNYLTSKILKNSRIYMLLNFVLNNKEEKSLIQLSSDLMMSATTFGKILAKCNKILAEFDLKIKYGKIVGETKQLIYFSYQFFWFIYDYRTTNEDLVFFLEKQYNIKLDIVQRTQIGLLRQLIEKYYIYIKNSKIDESIYEQLHDTKLYKDVYFFYRNKYINWNNQSIVYVTLLTIVFFKGFSMLPFKIIKLYSFKERSNLCIFDQLLTILNEVYDFEKLEDRTQLEVNIITTLYKLCMFNGLWYSVDEITLNYYFISFNSKFNTSFITALVDFLENDLCFKNKKVHLKYLYEVLVVSLFPLKKKKDFSIKLGYICKASPILSNAVSNKIAKKLEEKVNVVVESFRDDCEYDLVISDFSEEHVRQLSRCKNYNNYYRVTNLAVNVDIKELSTIVEKIEYDKYFSKAERLFS